MKATFDNQPRTHLRRGLLQKAVTTRDRCVAHFFGLVATCDVRGTCPTQQLPLLFNLIQMGSRKTNIVFRRPSDRGGIHVLKSSKKQTKNHAFFHSYVPGISYVRTCRNPAPPAINSSLFILTWDMGRSMVSRSRIVEYLCLASPGPSRIDHSTPNHTSA